MAQACASSAAHFMGANQARVCKLMKQGGLWLVAAFMLVGLACRAPA